MRMYRARQLLCALKLSMPSSFVIVTKSLEQLNPCASSLVMDCNKFVLQPPEHIA